MACTKVFSCFVLVFGNIPVSSERMLRAQLSSSVVRSNGNLRLVQVRHSMLVDRYAVQSAPSACSESLAWWVVGGAIGKL